MPTLEEQAWRATEPHTPNPRARLEAVAELNRRGIPCGVLIAPLMPGVNDSPEQVERIIDLAARGAYAPRAERERLARLVAGGSDPGRRFIRPRPGSEDAPQQFVAAPPRQEGLV